MASKDNSGTLSAETCERNLPYFFSGDDFCKGSKSRGTLPLRAGSFPFTPPAIIPVAQAKAVADLPLYFRQLGHASEEPCGQNHVESPSIRARQSVSSARLSIPLPAACPVSKLTGWPLISDPRQLRTSSAHVEHLKTPLNACVHLAPPLRPRILFSSSMGGTSPTCSLQPLPLVPSPVPSLSSTILVLTHKSSHIFASPPISPRRTPRTRQSTPECCRR